MNLVTTQEAAAHLRIDYVTDGDLDLKIAAASSAVLAYLKSAANAWILNGTLILDSGGSPLLPAQVKQATLLLIGEFFINREGSQNGEIGGALGIPHGYGYLPRAVVALLYPLRDPALA